MEFSNFIKKVDKMIDEDAEIKKLEEQVAKLESDHICVIEALSVKEKDAFIVLDSELKNYFLDNFNKHDLKIDIKDSGIIIAKYKDNVEFLLNISDKTKFVSISQNEKRIKAFTIVYSSNITSYNTNAKLTCGPEDKLKILNDEIIKLQNVIEKDNIKVETFSIDSITFSLQEQVNHSNKDFKCIDDMTKEILKL